MSVLNKIFNFVRKHKNPSNNSNGNYVAMNDFRQPSNQSHQLNFQVASNKNNKNNSNDAHFRTLSHKKSSSISGIQNFTNNCQGDDSKSRSNANNNIIGNEVNKIGSQYVLNTEFDYLKMDKGFYYPVDYTNNSNNAFSSDSYNKYIDKKVATPMPMPMAPTKVNKTSNPFYKGNIYKNEIITYLTHNLFCLGTITVECTTS